MPRTTYMSTRGGEKGLTFEEVVLGGLAKDTGLYVPEEIPTITLDEIEDMRSMSFTDLAYTVISKFVSEEDISAASLKDIVTRSFSKFRTPEAVPCVKKKYFWGFGFYNNKTGWKKENI